MCGVTISYTYLVGVWVAPGLSSKEELYLSPQVLLGIKVMVGVRVKARVRVRLEWQPFS